MIRHAEVQGRIPGKREAEPSCQLEHIGFEDSHIAAPIERAVPIQLEFQGEPIEGGS